MPTNFEIVGFPSLLDSLTHADSRDLALRACFPQRATLTAGDAIAELIRASEPALTIAVDTRARRIIATSDSATRTALFSALSGGVPLELEPDNTSRAPTWTRLSRHAEFPEGLEDDAIQPVKPARSVGALVNFLLTKIKDAGYFGFALVDQQTGRVWLHAIDGETSGIVAALSAVPVNAGTIGIVLNEPTKLAFT